jgi:hypothetical protein
MIRAIAVAGLVASFAASAADIQKCADASGRITYQDAPCPPGSAIGAVPRESAQADPAALRQLEREKARIERAADAQRAAELQQQAAPVVVQQLPQQGVASGTPTTTGAPYTAPVNVVDPNTGAVIVPGTTAVIDANTGTVLSLGTNPAQVAQPSTDAATLQPSPITQPPTAAPSSITQVPSASQPNTASTPPNASSQAVITSPGTVPSQAITPSPSAPTSAPAVGAPR